MAKEPRTLGASQRLITRQSDVTGGVTGRIARKLNNYPDQKRSIDDSPTTMAKNRAALRKGK